MVFLPLAASFCALKAASSAACLVGSCRRALTAVETAANLVRIPVSLAVTGVVRVIFDLDTAYFLFPESDPNLPLALEGDGVPLLFGRSYHMPVLGRDVGFEQFEHGSPTVPLDDNVV